MEIEVREGDIMITLKMDENRNATLIIIMEDEIYEIEGSLGEVLDFLKEILRDLELHLSTFSQQRRANYAVSS